MTSFLFVKYFDAFELDVNVVNFVYYGKTRIDFVLLFDTKHSSILGQWCILSQQHVLFNALFTSIELNGFIFVKINHFLNST